MGNSMTLNQTKNSSLPNLEKKKAIVLKNLKSKAEQAKLNLIYIELEEANIPFERKYTTVKELTSDLKRNLSSLDYNKLKNIVDRINTQLDTTVEELSNGSTNAFTKLMTSDLTKTISKCLGISLAGRTALLLAPTITTKAVVGATLTGYGLYRIIKNRKEIKQANENNELNTILSELETTEKDNTISDTRFDKETQELIRKQLNKMGVEFQDTGYRSLRQAMYSLSPEQKRGLIDFLNNTLCRGIKVQERIDKAKKKLNIAASTATTVGLGAKLGSDVATAINGVDPGLLAGAINGTFLGVWANSVVEKDWFTALSGGLGFVGTEVLEKLPVVGEVAQNVFATENLAALTALGATGGLFAGLTLGLASGVKQIYNFSKNKQANEKFLKLDAEKYQEADKEEMKRIREKLSEPRNEYELIIIDIVVGYLKEQNISLGYTPKSINALKNAINHLKAADKEKAQEILVRVEDSFNDESLRDQFKKAGKISIALFTAGMAALSIYDIIKQGTFLPELSKKLFPENNIYNPIEIPSLDGPLDPTKDSAEIKEAAALNEEFHTATREDDLTNTELKYYHEDTGSNYLMDTAQAEYNASQSVAEDEGLLEKLWNDFWRDLGSMGRLEAASYYAFGNNIVDSTAEKIGIEIVNELVPDKVAISEKLNTLSPDKLLLFMRYMNNTSLEPTDMNQVIKETLNSSVYIEKVTEYIESFVELQKNHNFVIELTRKFALGFIPFSIFAETLGFAQKNNTNRKFGINNNEVDSAWPREEDLPKRRQL